MFQNVNKIPKIDIEFSSKVEDEAQRKSNESSTSNPIFKIVYFYEEYHCFLREIVHFYEEYTTFYKPPKVIFQSVMSAIIKNKYVFLSQKLVGHEV